MNDLLGRLYQAFDGRAEPIVDFVAAVLARHGAPARPHVADVGCGPGRLLAPMASRGWRVTAVEPAEAYRARARIAADGLAGIDVVDGDLEHLALAPCLDAVLAVNGPFAYLLTPAARRRAAAAVFGALAPGGLFLLDVPCFPWILRNFHPPVAQHAPFEGGTVRLLRTPTIDWHAATFTTLETYVLSPADGSPDVTYERTHVFAMTTYPELEDTLRGAGFTSFETFNGWSSRSSEPLVGSRIIIAARKPLE